jgi:hypothetical protein
VTNDFLELSTSADTWWRLRAKRGVSGGVVRYESEDPEEFEINKLLRRPETHPHFKFRNLRYGRDADALKFLAAAGPLTLNAPDVNDDEMGGGTIDLRTFWARWRRFIAVVQLWESHPKSPNLKAPGVSLNRAWDYVCAHLDEIDYIGAPLFEKPDWRQWWLMLYPSENRPEITTTSAPWPGDWPEERYKERDYENPAVWPGELPGPPPQYLDEQGDPIQKPADYRDIPNPRQAIPEFNDLQRNQLALWLIERELNRHSQPTGRWLRSIEYDPSDCVESVSFRVVLSATPMWALIWQLFAQETCSQRSWRICPHCNRAFYPPRKDRYFCTPRLQQLYSKRRWANENR